MKDFVTVNDLIYMLKREVEQGNGDILNPLKIYITTSLTEKKFSLGVNFRGLRSKL